MPSPRTGQVIGAGIVGLCAAIALQKRGLVVRLWDEPRSDAPASYGNAGHIATEQCAPLASMDTIRSLPKRLFVGGGPVSFPPREISHWAPFSLRLLAAARPTRYRVGLVALSALLANALPAWRQLIARLGRPELLREQGHLVAWASGAAAKAGRAAWARAPLGETRIADLEPETYARLNGALGGHVSDAIQFHGSASTPDPFGTLAALKALFVAGGGVIHRGRAGALSEVVRNAEYTIVAAGYGARRLMEEFGVPTPMIAERGYHIQGPAPHWPRSLAPVVLEERALVLHPMAEGLRLTSFVEFGGPDALPDPRKWRRLQAHADDLGIRFTGPVQHWVGARPTLPDYLPAIGRLRRAPRIIAAYGHQHLGLTLGPLTGELVAALVCDEPVDIDLAPFAPERFGRP